MRLLHALAPMLVFSAVLLSLSVNAEFGWDINIDLRNANDNIINQTDEVMITVTAPEESFVYVEIQNASSNVVAMRFPETGLEELPTGIGVWNWVVPDSFPLGLYYLMLKDDIDATRDVMSFKVHESSGDVQEDEGPTVQELLDKITRTELAHDRLRRRYDAFVDDIGGQINFMWVTFAVIGAMSIAALLSAFQGRSKALKNIFSGEKEERETETQKELLKILKYFVRREIPTSILPTEIGEPRKIPKSVQGSTPQRTWQKKYEITCEWCGETFLAATPKAKFCPDKSCRVHAWKAKKESQVANRQNGEEGAS